MSKRNNITYIKPADPKFLREIKQQIGYQEGPTVDTKRQRFEEDLSSGDEAEDEAPQIVVVKKGDLTAEQAELEKKRIEQEENGTPADLSQRVVFKSKRSQKAEKLEEGSSQEKPKKSKRPEPAKSKLSFQDDEEEDE